MRGDRLAFDQALRDVTALQKETPWDVARRLAGMLVHVWHHRDAGGTPETCATCATAEVYVRVLEGGLQIGPDPQEG